MKKTFGTPTGENGQNFPSLLMGKRVYMIANYPTQFAAGHTSIISDVDCLRNCWFNLPEGVYWIGIWEPD